MRILHVYLLPLLAVLATAAPIPTPEPNVGGTETAPMDVPIQQVAVDFSATHAALEASSKVPVPPPPPPGTKVVWPTK